MQKGFVNFAFALFAALLLAGSAFAANSTELALNKAPVITGVGGPTSLSVNQAGTWSVSAYDPDGNYLSYYVNWGEGGSAVPASSDNPGSTATFQHTYSAAGAYTITFTVTDSLGATTVSTVTVAVTSAGGSSPKIVRVWQQDESFEPVHMLYAEITDGSGVANLNDDKVTFQITYPNGKTESYSVGYHTPGTGYSYNDYYGFGFSKGSQCGTYRYVVTAERRAGNSAAAAKEGSFTLGSQCSSSDNAALSTLGKISYWHGKVNQHTDASGAWQTDPDGSSGANLDKISYCKKFYPGTADIMETDVATLSGWKDAGNSGGYTSIKAVYKCVGTYVAPSNLPPVISGVSGPSSLSVNQQGTWVISAYDPDGTYLSYSVNWGEGGISPSSAASAGSTGTFQHTYSSAGTYTITFTVADSAGASTQSATYVSVGGATGGPADLYVSTSVIEPTNTLDSRGNHLVNWKAYVQNVGTETSGKYTLNSYIDDALVPSQQEMTYSGLAAGKWYITPYYSSYISAGSHRLKLVITPLGPDADPSNNEYTQKFDVNGVSSNLPPVITGGSGPASLAVNAVGTWKVSAYDPDGTYLSYSVNWGDQGALKSAADSSQTGSTATFQHAYSAAGTYTIKFTVSDASGAQAQTALAVAVGSGAASGLKVNRIWTEPDLLNPYSTTIYSEVLDGTQPASPSGVKVTYAYTFPDGSTYSGQVGQSAQNPEYKNKGYFGVDLGAGAQCGAYSLKVTATRTITSSAQASDPATGYATFTLKEPYCTQAASKVSIKLEKGWNMVSDPNAGSLKISEIAQKCKVASNAWAYNPLSNSYTAASFLSGGMGYWLYASEECSFEIDLPYIEKMSLGLNAGWNMIGASGKTVQFSDYTGDCSVTSGPWAYSPSAGQYVQSSTLEPAKAYWVKAAADCTLKSASDTPPAAPSG